MEGPMEVNSTRFPSGIPALADWLHVKGKGATQTLPAGLPALQDHSQCMRQKASPEAHGASQNILVPGRTPISRLEEHGLGRIPGSSFVQSRELLTKGIQGSPTINECNVYIMKDAYSHAYSVAFRRTEAGGVQ